MTELPRRQLMPAVAAVAIGVVMHRAKALSNGARLPRVTRAAVAAQVGQVQLLVSSRMLKLLRLVTAH